jgi:hypothetical protein
MSEIKTDKLTGTSTAGSILVTGENNSTTLNLQQSMVKCWLTMANDASVATNGSFGIASTVDSSPGRYNVNFSNNFSGAGAYSVGMIAVDADGNGYIGDNTDTSSCQFRNYSGGFVDAPTQGIICGDLA